MFTHTHIVQFVLHCAENYTGDWDEFMQKLARVYNDCIPDDLLIGLERNACPALQSLCSHHLRENKRKKENHKNIKMLDVLY